MVLVSTMLKDRCCLLQIVGKAPHQSVLLQGLLRLLCHGAASLLKCLRALLIHLPPLLQALWLCPCLLSMLLSPHGAKQLCDALHRRGNLPHNHRPLPLLPPPLLPQLVLRMLQLALL
jgi:hypothetical protein